MEHGMKLAMYLTGIIFCIGTMLSIFKKYQLGSNPKLDIYDKVNISFEIFKDSVIISLALILGQYLVMAFLA